MSEFKAVIKSFVIVLIMTILAKIASFISELIIAFLLGTSEKADMYSMIIGIHQVIYPMISVGIWSIFLPMYKKEMINNSEDNANELLCKVLTLFSIISVILIIIINIFSKQIIMIVANGFNSDMQKICVDLLRIYSPYFIFVILSSIYAAVLQCHEKFFGSQIREMVTYLPTIFLGPLAYRMYDLYGLVIVLVIGSVFRLLVLIPFLNKNIRFKFDFHFKTKKNKEMLHKMPSVLITSGIEQINILVDKMMASNLVVGSVSGLSYGNKLINVFNGFFTSSISTASYSTMSQYVAEKRINDLKKIVCSMLIIMAIIIIPITMISIILNKEIVTIIFARGLFDDNSINITSKTFIGYLIGMYFIGTKGFINNVFYSFGDTKKIMKISIISIIINIVLNIILTKIFGVVGLAVATSISSIIYYILTTILLRRKECIDNKKVYCSLLKIYAISIFTALICIIIKSFIGYYNYILKTIIISFAFIILYLLLLNFARIEETKEVIHYIKSKIKKVMKHGN